MENLELLKKVAEALGLRYQEDTDQDICSYGWYDNNGMRFRPWWDPTIDHHAALDVLMEFCEKKNYKWEN